MPGILAGKFEAKKARLERNAVHLSMVLLRTGLGGYPLLR
jgi:hypothetical protein